MIGVDTNILVYAHRAEGKEHKKAFELIKQLFGGSAPWFIAWPSVYEFLRVVTHPSILTPPSSSETAIEFIRYLSTSPSLRIVSHSQDHMTSLEDLASTARTAGNLFFDTQIAAILAEWGIRELYTRDRDFKKFKQLRSIDPFEE
jgi:toxin-antitoxin system PIN domain toxin